MPAFSFTVPLAGEATYKVEAESLEEAAKLLEKADCNEGYVNKYLVESDVGCDLPCGREPLHEKLMHLAY